MHQAAPPQRGSLQPSLWSSRHRRQSPSQEGRLECTKRNCMFQVCGHLCCGQQPRGPVPEDPAHLPPGHHGPAQPSSEPPRALLLTFAFLCKRPCWRVTDHECSASARSAAPEPSRWPACPPRGAAPVRALGWAEGRGAKVLTPTPSPLPATAPGTRQGRLYPLSTPSSPHTHQWVPHPQGGPCLLSRWKNQAQRKLKPCTLGCLLLPTPGLCLHALGAMAQVPGSL